MICFYYSAMTFCFFSRKERRFLVIDVLQLILVEPDSRRLGWGVVKFVGFLQVGASGRGFKCSDVFVF
jgi:hypothetical protein